MPIPPGPEIPGQGVPGFPAGPIPEVPKEPEPAPGRDGELVIVSADGAELLSNDGEHRIRDPDANPCCVPSGPCDMCSVIPTTLPMIVSGLVVCSSCIEHTWRANLHSGELNGTFDLTFSSGSSTVCEWRHDNAVQLRIRQYAQPECFNLVNTWYPFYDWIFTVSYDSGAGKYFGNLLLTSTNSLCANAFVAYTSQGFNTCAEVLTHVYSNIITSCDAACVAEGNVTF